MLHHAYASLTNWTVLGGLGGRIRMRPGGAEAIPLQCPATAHKTELCSRMPSLCLQATCSFSQT